MKKEAIQVSINTDEISKSTNVIELARKADLEIKNDEQAKTASEILSDIKKKYKELEEQRKSITKPIDDAKKQVMALYKAPMELLERAERHLKGLILKFQEEKERKAREEAERIRRLAEEEAEKQRKKLEAQIQKAQDKGKVEKVEELIEKKNEIENTPIIIPNIVPSKPADNISFKEIWKAVVVDFKELPDEYKIPNQQTLDRVAQATKGTVKIPGVVFEMQKIVVAR